MVAVKVLWQALRLWWQDWIGILFLNVVWFLLQLPIITGPVATAVFYTLCQRMVEGEIWDIQDGLSDFKRLFWPAWRWALPNLILLLIIVGNFFAYRDFEGAFWRGLRLLWGSVALLWMMTNLFFWPFWLAQTDKSLKTTYQNLFRFFLLQPSMILILLTVISITLAFSIWTVFPLTVGIVGWLILVTITAVRHSLAQYTNNDE